MLFPLKRFSSRQQSDYKYSRQKLLKPIEKHEHSYSGVDMGSVAPRTSPLLELDILTVLKGTFASFLQLEKGLAN